MIVLDFGSLSRLSPVPMETDYFYSLAENEGVCDLFDIPLNANT